MATAIPKISDHFKALNDVGWYASAFFLTTYDHFRIYITDDENCATTDIWKII